MEAGAAVTLSGRDAYRDELTELARHDPRVLCLEADLGGRRHPFAAAHPDRFLNVGIAEAAMIDVAVGLAAGGHRPFVSTFAGFAALRAAESLKLGLGYQRAPVTVVAPYAGVSGAWFGTTHHCLEDLAVLQSFPGVGIAAPYGEAETRAVIRAALAADRPYYVRVGRNAGYESLPGTGPVIWDGRGDGRLCLVSVGEVGTELCRRARALHPELGHAHLCYLDAEPLARAATELAAAAGRLLVVEEHRPAGGIGSSLALLLPAREVRAVTAGTGWPSGGGSHEDVLAELGLDLPAVLAAAGVAA